MTAKPLLPTQPYENDLWRVVEAQHRASTMRLVDTNEEQEILEALVEEVKPALPPACAGLHFLLAAPFRYAPYPRGSRFRRAGQAEGAFYASEAIATALAEAAFYRLLFLIESPDMKVPDRPVEHTAFKVACRAERALDLTKPPFGGREDLKRTSDYAACQALADAARGQGVAAIRYLSVRDPRGGANVALLTPEAFVRKQPKEFQSWRMLARRDGVRAMRDFPKSEAFEFPRAVFAGDARLG